ncbi:MAG: toll/interleukin-1 receptor domain-containing protein [Bacteroidales bacterium]|nr:toll/interleukin-1 receptor domain-containing protein [Bacteroidales bacterium]
MKVFISYSWDSDEHKLWVLNIAQKLSENGVYVILDRFDLMAGKNMTHFMEESIDTAEKVIVIMTPNYKKKANARSGGVGFEYSMLTQEIFQDQDTDKYIPIRRNGDYSECAPKFLGSLISIDMTNDVEFEDKFEKLLKTIYEEPEIKRPTLGKKPSFLSKSNLDLIDEKLQLRNSVMKYFAKWKCQFKLNSIKEYDTPKLFKLINENIIIDIEENITLPFILNNRFKISHYPELIYEMPLQNYIASNHLINEKIKIENNRINYEFAEFSDQYPWFLNLSTPFSTIFQLLIILRKIHYKIGFAPYIDIKLEFEANEKSYLHRNSSPFDYRSNPFESYLIPNNKASYEFHFNIINVNSLFDFFQKNYHLFISETKNSIVPFVTLIKEEFELLTKKYLDD